MCDEGSAWQSECGAAEQVGKQLSGLIRPVTATDSRFCFLRAFELLTPVDVSAQ